MTTRNSMRTTSGKAACNVPAAFRPWQSAPRRSIPVLRAAGNTQGGFMADMLKMAKKVQGSLPIIGLVSRLVATDGGFDELAYPEYCRSVFDKAPVSMSVALQELEKKYGKLATSRWVLLVLWMVNTGMGLVAAKDIMSAAKRLRVTQDIEVEIERFEGARFATKKKYEMMTPPAAKPQDKAAVAVDALCVLCLGLKDGQAVPADDAGRLMEVVLGSMPDVSREVVEACVAGRTTRAAYV